MQISGRKYFWIVLLALVGTLFVVEIGVRLINPLSSVVKYDIVDIQSPSILRAKLRAFENHNGFKVALLGDSVPYGRSMLEHGDQNWREHTLDRVIDADLIEKMARDDIYVANFGMNGAVPMDSARIAEEVIQAGADLIIFNTNLRGYSDSFSDADAQWSRPWLSDFETDGIIPAVEELWQTYGLSEFLQWRILNASPRNYAASALQWLNAQLGYTPPKPHRLELTLKARARYASVNFDDNNPQKRALQTMLERAENNNVPMVVFYTTENPRQIDQVMPPQLRMPLMAELESTIKQASSQAVYLGPIAELEVERFLDLVHLDANGYQIVGSRVSTQAARLLASNQGQTVDTGSIALEWLGRLDPYQRGGVIEVFGGLFRPIKNGPLSVRAIRFEALETNALVAWGGRDFRANDTNKLRFALECGATLPTAFRIGALLGNGNLFTFTINDGEPESFIGEASLPNLTPTAFAPLIAQPTFDTPMVPFGCGLYEVAIPEALRDALNNGQAVEHFFIQAVGLEAAQTFDLLAMSFVSDQTFEQSVKGTLEGELRSGNIILETARGQRQEIAVTPESPQDFVFAVDNPNTQISVYFEPQNRTSDLRFSNQGRWFLASEGSDLTINLGPRFVAAEDDAVVPPRREQFPELFNRKRTLSFIGSGFPHQRYTYMGRGGDVREWNTYTFTNWQGFFDRDRNFNEQLECLRIAIAGGSNITTIMHKLSDKANFRLEAELGIALQQCVEVISVGMGGGNLAAYYSRAEQYLAEAKVDYLLLEFHPTTMFEAHPDIARIISGIDPAYPKHDTLAYNANGHLEWRRRTREHREHISSVDVSDAAKLRAQFSAPLNQAQELVREAYDLAFDIVDYAQNAFPETKVIPFAHRHVPIRQTELRRTSTDTHTILGFSSNLESICEARALTCFITPYVEKLSEPSTDLLTWEHDNHHNHFGIDYFVHAFADWFLPIHRDQAEIQKTSINTPRFARIFPSRSVFDMTPEERRQLMIEPRETDGQFYVRSMNEDTIAISDFAWPLIEACLNNRFSMILSGQGSLDGIDQDAQWVSADELLSGAITELDTRTFRMDLRAESDCATLPATILMRNEDKRRRYNRLVSTALLEPKFAVLVSDQRRSDMIMPLCEDLLANYDAMLEFIQKQS